MKHCWPLFHRYSKWEDHGTGDLTATSIYNEKLKVQQGYFIQQIRRCERCGKVQLRRERVKL